MAAATAATMAAAAVTAPRAPPRSTSSAMTAIGAAAPRSTPATRASSSRTRARRTASRPVWGTGPYTTDSSVCTAAVHAGYINLKEGGRVVIQIRKGSDSYEGSTQHGITTEGYHDYRGSSRSPVRSAQARIAVSVVCTSNCVAVVALPAAVAALRLGRAAWRAALSSQSSGDMPTRRSAAASHAVSAGVISGTRSASDRPGSAPTRRTSRRGAARPRRASRRPGTTASCRPGRSCRPEAPAAARAGVRLGVRGARAAGAACSGPRRPARSRRWR